MDGAFQEIERAIAKVDSKMVMNRDIVKGKYTSSQQACEFSKAYFSFVDPNHPKNPTYLKVTLSTLASAQQTMLRHNRQQTRVRNGTHVFENKY